MKKNLKKFLICAGIRALRTFAQAVISYVGTSAIVLKDVAWGMALSAAALAAILSILTSIVTGLPEVEDVE